MGERALPSRVEFVLRRNSEEAARITADQREIVIGPDGHQIGQTIGSIGKKVRIVSEGLYPGKRRLGLAHNGPDLDEGKAHFSVHLQETGVAIDIINTKSRRVLPLSATPLGKEDIWER